MARPQLKSYLPRSLFLRASLILIGPLIVLQLVVAVVFVQRHFEDVTRQMTQNIAREIAVAQQVIDTSPSAAIAQLRLLNLSEPLAIGLSLDPDATDTGDSSRFWYDLSGRALMEEMTALLGPSLRVDLASNIRRVDARIETEKGVLRAVIPRTRVTASNPHQLLVLMIVTSLVLGVIAILFLRNQMRPIHELADAADAFGKGRSVPFRPAGAEEVRRAGQAFLAMRSRIERAIEQRTLMLSGVSHDLRTPLTRMKLTLALAEDMPEAAAMGRDVNEMKQMLDAFLAFARGDQMEETEAIDLREMVADLGERARRAGVRIEVLVDADPDTDAVVSLREAAVCRALMNLINNAARYGTTVRLSLKLQRRQVIFVVEDDGPGVPADKHEEVMRPFTRLDTARNQDKGGGVGLGMAIALDVARSHGGALELGESAMGGLSAVFRLPR